MYTHQSDCTAPIRTKVLVAEGTQRKASPWIHMGFEKDGSHNINTREHSDVIWCMKFCFLHLWFHASEENNSDHFKWKKAEFVGNIFYLQWLSGAFIVIETICKTAF